MKNPYGLSFELVDTASIDYTKKKLTMANQNPIINGVELDANYKPIYYYITQGTVITYEGGKIEKLPAKDIIHIYKREFPKQTRGIPPLNAVLNDIKQLEDYKVAELMAAKSASCLVTFYEPNNLNPQGMFDGDEDERGEFIQELAPRYGNSCSEGIFCEESRSYTSK